MIRVAFVSPEVHPFSKTGGLADVAAALPAALATHDVRTVVFSPCYRAAARVLAERTGQVTELSLSQRLWVGSEQHALVYRRLQDDGREFVFVVNDAYYDRDALYVDADGRDYADSVARFAFFCRAVLEYALFTGDIPDILHGNDWQAGLAAVYLKTIYRQPALQDVRSIMTIHNLGYQGMFPADRIYATGLGWDVFHPEALEFYNHLNLLKGGIVFADAVTTVSPTYAEEIQTPELGRGLDGVIRAHRGKLSGILNGIDIRRWDPAHDRYLPARYAAERLNGKASCKRALRQRLGLPHRPRSMLLGVISRFDWQKGMHLIVEAFPTLTGLDVQLAVLGSGDHQIEQRMRDLMAAYPDRVSVVFGFDEALAHLIEAGADAFLMPSAYEPSGLNQMYSQRYGTIPIVRETGGLKDTVIDCTPESLKAGTASGFTFAPFEAPHLAHAIRRAAELYLSKPARWRALVRHIMQIDHSWEESARVYATLYRRVLSTVHT